MQGLIIGLLLTWLSWPYIFFLSFTLPGSLWLLHWFSTASFACGRRGCRRSSLAQQTLYPWMNYTMKNLLLRATKKSQASGGGQPCSAIQAFYLLKRDFVLKTFPCLFSWKEEPPEDCMHLMTPFQNEHLSVSQTGPLYLKVTQNHSEMERLARWSDKPYL